MNDEEIVLKHAKIKGGHGEGLGTGLPNDVDYTDAEVEALKFITGHIWPAPDQHLWSEWMANSPMPKPSKRRVCLHPDCHAVEVQATPITG